MTEVDTSRERLERLQSIGCADYLHMALLDALDAERAENERLQTALHYYAEQFCEMGSDWEGCGKLTEEQCAGCRARAALNKGDSNAE